MTVWSIPSPNFYPSTVICTCHSAYPPSFLLTFSSFITLLDFCLIVLKRLYGVYFMQSLSNFELIRVQSSIAASSIASKEANYSGVYYYKQGVSCIFNLSSIYMIVSFVSSGFSTCYFYDRHKLYTSGLNAFSAAIHAYYFAFVLFGPTPCAIFLNLSLFRLMKDVNLASYN